MTPLPQVTTALREAHADLPAREQVRDLAYLLDVDPYGSEALVLYVKIGEGAVLSAPMKRKVEAVLREKLQSTVDYQVFFRWLSEDEDPGDSSVGDEPVSALH